MKKISSIAVDHEKVIRSYKSCITWEHFESAVQLHKNFISKWRMDKNLLDFHERIIKVEYEMVNNLNGKNN